MSIEALESARRAYQRKRAAIRKIIRHEAYAGEMERSQADDNDPHESRPETHSQELAMLPSALCQKFGLEEPI